jgi:hypothetical protein
LRLYVADARARAFSHGRAADLPDAEENRSSSRVRSDAKWNLSVWARNVTDKDCFDFLSVQSGSTGMIAGQPAEQRTYGVTYSVEF